MIKKSVNVFLLVLFSMLIFSCAKKEDEIIFLDNREPLALAPDVQWAVVNEPYVAFKENKEWTSSVTGHCRKGDVLQVKGKSVDSKKEVWYLFEEGWLPSASILVYSNRLKAQKVSDSYKMNLN